MRKFLMLKHWQLFALFMGLPIIFQFVTIGSVVFSGDPTTMFYFFPIMMIIIIGLCFGWFYALGTSLYKKLPAGAKMNLTCFKIFLLITVVYLIFFSVFVGTMCYNLLNNKEPNLIIFALIIPLHLFSMFCVIYCTYFNARALKTVELQRAVTFNDFVGEFFLFWLFPVGIWFIQPRINKLFDVKLNNNDNQILEVGIEQLG
ncbi:MAG: hypothetical protein DI598_03780 [Pseudopedobacter saltans]|uniref:Uncharacterized protein n=1 Tax=Pseudopedobacter saltans TaxID=151895 RepID=A0A2W5GZE3_9SPHI|nr:MAG: hypothetical protein DI598_03780 [Pseudopedobacter saltans]